MTADQKWSLRSGAMIVKQSIIERLIRKVSTSFKATFMELLSKLEQLIFGLTKDNFEISIEQTMELFDLNFPLSYNLIICNLIYYSFLSRKEVGDLYLNFLEMIQSKEADINKNSSKIIDTFSHYLIQKDSHESNYLIEKMIERNMLNKNITNHINSYYFIHYKTEENMQKSFSNSFFMYQRDENYEELSKNDWELHKKYVTEGVNPNKISKVIRNDDIEKLQEMSSLPDFNFNQIIESSLYERYGFVNHDLSLIDFAAFFGSIKCFKYLLANGVIVNNTGKYAIAGGNIEIIHLCEQNHSIFRNAYETAIIFHQNDIFKYIYENKIEKLDENAQHNSQNLGNGNSNQSSSDIGMEGNKINNLGFFCIKSGNYEILKFLLENGLEINEFLLNEIAKSGNIYLIKHFLQNNQIPRNILVFATESRNIELVKYILGEEGIDINAKNIYLFYLIFILII